ncbi:MAG: alpha/beta hydrolase [Planctomycetaceae bacterium]
MKIDVTHVESFDGIKLSVRRFQAVGDQTNRTCSSLTASQNMQAVTGNVGMYCAYRGWNVLVPDLRGQGNSGGAPMHVDHFEDFCSDLESIRNHFELALKI